MENISNFLDAIWALRGWIAIGLGVMGLWAIGAGAFGDTYTPADR